MCRMCLFINLFDSLNVVFQSTPPPTSVADISSTFASTSGQVDVKTGKNQSNRDDARQHGGFQRIACIF